MLARHFWAPPTGITKLRQDFGLWGSKGDAGWALLSVPDTIRKWPSVRTESSAHSQSNGFDQWGQHVKDKNPWSNTQETSRSKITDECCQANFVAGQPLPRASLNLPAGSMDTDVLSTLSLASQVFTLSDTQGNMFLSQGHNMPHRSSKHKGADSSTPKGL